MIYKTENSITAKVIPADRERKANKMSEKNKKKVVAAGHICLDITPQFTNDPSDQISDLLRPGSLLHMGPADVHIGGSVANTGLGMKVLGADVTVMGKIGTDAFGLLVKEQISKYVPTKYMIETDDDSTSYSVVIAPRGTDRMFLHCPGTNASFSSEELDYEEIRSANLFHFGYPPLMKKMFENDGEELVRMFRKVKEMGTATSLDTASVDERAESGKADWELILKKVLPYVDFFVPSVEELAFMINKPLYREWSERANGKDITEVIQLSEVQELAETLLDWGTKVVLIKCGTPGLFLATAGMDDLSLLSSEMDLDFFGWENVRHFEKSYCPEHVLSATGAGDTTIAAFLYSVLCDYDWQKCVQLATATGACCVEAYDALSGLKPFEELEARIGAGWQKQHLLND